MFVKIRIPACLKIGPIKVKIEPSKKKKFVSSCMTSFALFDSTIRRAKKRIHEIN